MAEERQFDRAGLQDSIADGLKSSRLIACSLVLDNGESMTRESNEPSLMFGIARLLGTWGKGTSDFAIFSCSNDSGRELQLVNEESRQLKAWSMSRGPSTIVFPGVFEIAGTQLMTSNRLLAISKSFST